MPKDEQIIVQGHCGRAIYFRRKDMDAAADATASSNPLHDDQYAATSCRGRSAEPADFRGRLAAADEFAQQRQKEGLAEATDRRLGLEIE
ncbi:hypothetical protein RHECNPAF_520011 [Rhizobium etli CNPAF512]|nr:hypothetical protein RHECNPAF_520011 [Rhizobium etli CNPAF512]